MLTFLVRFDGEDERPRVAVPDAGTTRSANRFGDVELGSPKQRSVLAVLLLHANGIVPTDRIIDLV